jgi:hypothetical protein
LEATRLEKRPGQDQHRDWGGEGERERERERETETERDRERQRRLEEKTGKIRDSLTETRQQKRDRHKKTEKGIETMEEGNRCIH